MQAGKDRIMKKYSILTLTAAIILTATGCTNADAESYPVMIDNPENTALTLCEPEPADSTVANTFYHGEEGTTVAEDFEEAKAGVEGGSFISFDGNPLNVSEAVNGNVLSEGGSRLVFNCAYIAYRKPCYIDSNMYSALVDPGTGKISAEYKAHTEKNDEYFKVEAGDVLNNGLKVTDARIAIDITDSGISVAEIEVAFTGEVTLKGLLFCRANDYLSFFKKGDLTFVPTSNNDPFPIEYNIYTEDFLSIDAKTGFACARSHLFSVGNVNDMDPALAEMVEEGGYINVEVTLKNVSLVFLNTGSVRGSSAVITSVRPLS